MPTPSIEAVVFREENQKVLSFFGPTILFSYLTGKPSTLVNFLKPLEALPPSFLSEEIVSRGSVENIKTKGSDETIRVLFLPWALLPDDLNYFD